MLKQLINKHSYKIPIYDVNNNKNIKTNSFFNIKINEFNNQNNNPNLKFIKNKNENIKLKTQKIILLPDNFQKKVLINMLESCRLIYNKANSILKSLKKIPKWNYIRTYLMKDYIKKINKIYKTPIHTLDYAVKDCVSHYNSCINNSNVKKFNVRYKKKNKNFLSMTLERETLRKNKFIPSLFKKDIKNKSNKSYISEHNIKISYDNKKNIFYFIKSVNLNEIKKETKKETLKQFISIDPGIRTFLNGYDYESFIEIGQNLESHLIKDIKKLDFLHTKNNKKYINKREELRKKLKNKINDLHWKSINFLISHYNNILIGILSTSDVIRNDKSKLSKLKKRLILFLEHFNFREKLKYKCNSKKINYLEIDEYYTSKTCSNCGNIKNNLGSNKIYHCNHCNIIIDRDYNGCRNILYKGLK